MKKAPWHSTNPNLSVRVYHDETQCTEGNNIESRYLALGTGNRPKCKRCAEISG